MLTLVLPTKNRADFLIRLLTYYNERRLAFHLVVADSSDHEQVEQTRRAVKALEQGLNLDHRVYPPEIGVFDKMCEAVNCVETPYAVLGADDDFFVPSALGEAVQFLQDNPDYSVAHGEAAVINLGPEATAYGHIAGVGRYNQRTIDLATGSKRLVDHLRNFSTTWYSVHRTEQLRRNFQKVAAPGLDYGFGELLPSCLSLIQGKSKKLDGLYMVRQVHSAQTAPNHGDFFDWVADPTWGTRYKYFRDCLAAKLVRQDGISMGEARGVVKQAFWLYLANGLVKKWHGYYDPRKIRPLNRWKQAVRMIPGARRAWYALHSFNSAQRDVISLPALLHPSSRYHADFMPIYQAVTDPPPEF